jgi:hypothetical protein
MRVGNAADTQNDRSLNEFAHEQITTMAHTLFIRDGSDTCAPLSQNE